MTASRQEIGNMVARAVESAQVVDMHTHLYPGAFDGLLLRGVDELITYHYLIAETLRCKPEETARYWSLSRTEQADLIWRTLFVERSPVSEACRGVLTTLQRYGLDVAARDLTGYREFFAGMNAREHVNLAFKTAGVRYAVMTNDPFDPEENRFWEQGFEGDERFKAALRLDGLLNDWPGAVDRLQVRGYRVNLDLNGDSLKEVVRFLKDCATTIQPYYLAVSLPPSFRYPDDSHRGRLLDGAVLPFCRAAGIPLALMIGVKKLTNPQLRLAGDSTGKSDIDSIERLCSGNPDNRFLVTLLARENQHELCVAARKFSNLLIFGCWWFLNNPSLIDEITRMRLELLGLSFVPQHSDARVLDQMVYKWAHSRGIIVAVLTDKYQDLAATGWIPNGPEIERDVERLMAGNFEAFIGRDRSMAYRDGSIPGNPRGPAEN